MNTIKAFLSSLLPSFERSRISQDVDLLRKEVKDSLLPALEAANAASAEMGAPAEATKKFQTAFFKALPQYQRQTVIGGILQLFQGLPEKLDVIDGLVLEMFAKDVTKDTLSYRKASVIQYLESARFISRYTSRMLIRHLSLQTYTNLKAKGADVGPYVESMSPAELRWLTDNEYAYLQTLKLFAQHPKDLAALLRDIPDIAVVPDRIEVVAHTVGVDKLDPLRLGFVPPERNPIYHARMVYTEWQVRVYESQVEEKRLIELRLLALKQSQAGKQDAKVDELIKYSEGRLSRLNTAISKMQEHVA